ncbi:unnamed protein product, partial [Scytosiphon promiscuus]
LFSLLYLDARSQDLTDPLTKARLLIGQRENEGAVLILNDLIKSNPTNYDILMYRSKAFFQMGQLDDSLNDAKEMLKHEKSLTKDQKYNANWNAGIALFTQSQIDSSLVYIIEAQKLKSKDFKTNQTLALVYMNLNRYDESMKFLELAGKINPNHFSNYKLKGQLYLMQVNLEKAILNLDKSINLNPSFASSYENRAAAKILMNNLDEACEDLKKAYTLG